MRKIHSKTKKTAGLRTHKPHMEILKGLKRKKRDKTYNTEVLAIGHAEKLGLKEGEYKIIPAKKNKKFAVKKN
ncbi:MAG: hypothetical protein V1859_02095 [archaeon]